MKKIKRIVADEKKNHESQLTGKTFYEMNPVELAAHQMARGVPVTTKDTDTLMAAQKYMATELRESGQTTANIRQNNVDRLGEVSW